MNPLSYFYTQVLWRPLFNGLVFFYTVFPWHDLGFAIILLTITIRLLLAPLMYKAQRAQKDLARMQPEVKRIQEQFKNDREGQGKALMELYAQHKVNPFSGCLVLLIQLPILIALFQVFQKGFQPAQLSYLYSFIQNPGALHTISFGFIDLAHGSIYFGILAALTQYFQSKMTLPPPVKGSGSSDMSQAIRLQTLYVFPGLIFFWSFTFPTALLLYWTTLNILGIVQEIVMRKYESRTNTQRT